MEFPGGPRTPLRFKRDWLPPEIFGRSGPPDTPLNYHLSELGWIFALRVFHGKDEGIGDPLWGHLSVNIDPVN